MAVNRRQASFLVRFALLIVVFYGVTTLRVVDEDVVKPYTRAIASVSAMTLNVCGVHVRDDHSVIAGPRFAVDVEDGCNGIEAIFFIAAAMIAFGAPLRLRLFGAITGFAVIEVLNILRVATLFLVGSQWPNLFEIFHLAVWQTIIFGAAVFTFVAWTAQVQKVHVARAR